MENKKRPRFFLDSNVFISGLYSKKGPPGKILTDFILGKIDIIISQKVLNEVIDVIKKKIPSVMALLEKFLTSYPPGIIKDPEAESVKKWKAIINEDDAAILVSAISCNTDYFITGDNHFFDNPDISRKSGLKIRKPHEYFEIIKNLDTMNRKGCTAINDVEE